MIIILLILIIVICLILLFLFNKDINKINNQIKYKNKTDSHFEIAGTHNFKEINRLKDEINHLYEISENQLEKTINKEKEMQNFISAISHDMRTPLTSIQGYLDLLKDASSKEEKEKYIEIIEYRLTNLKNMLEDLFTHAKLNDSDFKVEIEEISIYPIVCRILASFYKEFKDKNIEPVINFENERMKAKGNDGLFSRIMQNLVINALKHGTSDFKIVQKGNYIIFTNAINDDIDIDKIFDRFYKADKSRHQISSGLGLASVKEMVNALNWNISASLNDNYLSIIIELK